MKHKLLSQMPKERSILLKFELISPEILQKQRLEVFLNIS